MTDTVQELAFRNAVDRVNADKDVLPRTRLVAQIERIPTDDSFYASKQGQDAQRGVSLLIFKTVSRERTCAIWFITYVGNPAKNNLGEGHLKFF